MKSFPGFGSVNHHGIAAQPKSGWRFLRYALLAGVVLLALPRPAQAQVVYAGKEDGEILFAGVTGTGAAVQYGDRKMLGVTAFVDVDTRRHYGLEGEASWTIFHQTADVNLSTYLVGPRYRFVKGRYQPYVKALAGVGQFNFPYGYAHGSYLVVAPGGGLDYDFHHRLRFRLIDAEYQYWPQFTYGAMSNFSVSTGIRIRIF